MSKITSPPYIFLVASGTLIVLAAGLWRALA
jgi:hypothetical protein